MTPRAALALVALVVLATPVAAHGNYVSVDSQISADGTVRIELAVLVTDGFVVLHTDQDGQPGAVVGHASFDGYIGSDIPVTIDRDHWEAQSGNVTLWAVMHRDTGDREFEPDDDPPIRSSENDELVAERFVVRKGTAGPVNVIAERDHAQETDRNQVSIRAVRLPVDGYVVIRADDGGEPGGVVGKRALSAGQHLKVSVGIDEDFYETRQETFQIWAVVHGSDGDDQFEPTEDLPSTAGGEWVMSRFDVKRTDPIERTPTATVGNDHDDHDHTVTDGEQGEQTTPGTTEEHHHDGTADDHHHDDGHDHDQGSPSTEPAAGAPGQAGLGVVVAIAALIAIVLLGIRRSA